MQFPKYSVLAPAILFVAACSGDPDTNTNTRSEFATVGPNAFISKRLRDEASYKNVDAGGVGYAYKVGLDEDDRFTGLAALVGENKIAPPTYSGSAKYTGNASMLVVDRSSKDDIIGRSELVSKSVVVRVNMDSGEFSGRTSPSHMKNNLTFRGKVNAKGQMTGTSQLETFDGDIDGDFKGKAGDTTVIGAYHGNNGEDVYAGGLSATR